MLLRNIVVDNVKKRVRRPMERVLDERKRKPGMLKGSKKKVKKKKRA